MISPVLSRLTPLAVALALSGCAIGPDYLRPANLLPSLFAESKPAESVAIAVNPAIDARWWALFDDATLNDLVDQALRNNADLRLAVARVEQADAVAREAGASFFPEIDGAGATSNSKASSKKRTNLKSRPLASNKKNKGR